MERWSGTGLLQLWRGSRKARTHEELVDRHRRIDSELATIVVADRAFLDAARDRLLEQFEEAIDAAGSWL